MKACFKIIAVSFSLLIFAGCNDTSGDAGGQGAGEPVLYATNYPLAYFAQRIAGDAAEVRFPEIDGDPAFWKPSDEQVAQMQDADLIVTNGASYEKWAMTVSLPPSKTIDTSSGFASSLIAVKELGTHSHGGDGEHAHGGTAFTTWMDFDLASQQATAIRDALIELMPEHEDRLNANADALLADLSKLHEDMQAAARPINRRPFVASHPVYQYFARRYKLRIKSVLWEPEAVPSSGDLQALQRLLADHPAAWMIWEGEPAQESVALLRGIGISSVVIDPAGNRPDEGEWLSVMQQNIENLRSVTGAQEN